MRVDLFKTGFAFWVGCLMMGPTLLCAQTAASPHPPSEPIDNESCLLCHGDESEPYFVNSEQFDQSIHGGLLCTGCHSDIIETPHDTPQPVSCGTCHQLENEIYLSSDHNQFENGGGLDSKACRSCHGDPHTLLNSRDPQSPVFRKNIPATCGSCHQSENVKAPGTLNQDKPVTSYNESIHGIAFGQGLTAAAVCTDCHGAHDLNRATNPNSKLFWQNIPKTCGKCHENIFLTYSLTVHGNAVKAGKRDAPVCTDCHGEHSIESVKSETSKVYPSHVTETCGQCHSAQRIVSKYNLPSFVVDTYMQSYHGLAIQLGSLTAANCASCHGVHDILPHTDPRSSIHPDNLSKTCGKCHAGIGEMVAQGKIHSGRRFDVEHQMAGWVRQLYVMLIFAVIGFMLLHNALDFTKKLRIHYAAMKAQGKEMRMGINERIQHMILAASFILLGYSGFALKYPQSWWALPFAGHGDWRSLAHRGAALAFGLLAIYHVLYMIGTKKGRWHLKALAPRGHDFKQLIEMLQYYLGFRKVKPVLSHYSYIEKMEYWALVWGGIIMGVTGILMLSQVWFSNHFPKWLFDVVTAVHYYEAVLACLAIVIWHGYFVIFDPDEYPMKWTWINGQASAADEERKPEDHP